MANYELVLGDCLEILERYPDACCDAFITDPPFAMTGGISNGSSSQVDTQFFLHWWRAICTQLVRIMKPTGEGFIWCDWRTAALIGQGFTPKKQTYDCFQMTQVLHHYRQMPGQGTPFRNSVDMIAYVRGPKSKGSHIPNTTHNFISKYWYYGKHDHHPAEKDPELCMQLVAWCSDSEALICDPFTGSGSVGIACARTGRRFLGIEKDETFYVTAHQRIAQAYMCCPVTTDLLMPQTSLSLFERHMLCAKS